METAGLGGIPDSEPLRHRFAHSLDHCGGQRHGKPRLVAYSDLEFSCSNPGDIRAVAVKWRARVAKERLKPSAANEALVKLWGYGLSLAPSDVEVVPVDLCGTIAFAETRLLPPSAVELEEVQCHVLSVAVARESRFVGAATGRGRLAGSEAPMMLGEPPNGERTAPCDL